MEQCLQPASSFVSQNSNTTSRDSYESEVSSSIVQLLKNTKDPTQKHANKQLMYTLYSEEAIKNPYYH